MRSVLIMPLLLFGCQSSPPTVESERAPVPPVATPAAPGSDCGESVGTHYIGWLDSKIVNWRFVLDPDSGEVTPLRDSSYGAALDPGRGRVAAVRYEPAGETIELSDYRGNVLQRFEVPVFVDAPDLDAERVELLRSTAVMWWSDRDLLVIQDLLPSEAYISCRLLDVELGKWTDVSHCPEGDMIDLYSVDRGPADLVALYSSGEGHPAVSVVRWAPNTGPQRETEFPSFDLYPFGPMAVRFTEDPEVIFIETPCDLRLERGCYQKVNEDDDRSVFLFRWREDGLTLERSGLPPAATFEPGSGTWAWPTTRGVAVGDPDGEFACHEVEWRE